MASFSEVADEELVRCWVFRGASHASISKYYQDMHPGMRGLSTRSVRRYCSERGIHLITNAELEGMVRDFVSSYGHAYGRRLMQGSIRYTLGITSGAVSQRRVAVALRSVAPVAYEARARDAIDRTNPVPYYAPYFGFKCHFDQNEKIGQRYGCTHVIMIDGCSRFIVGYAAMPVKNPILIYEFVFKPAMQNYGVWEQVRMDHGLEFCLVAFVQNIISPYRLVGTSVPFRQTTSTKNNVVERFWPEINSRINYPLKRAMNAIIADDLTDTLNEDDPVFNFCLSWVMLYVSDDPVKHLLNSWNHHRIPGPEGCIPIQNMYETKHMATPPNHLIPSTPEVVRMYEENGGNLTRNADFGIDPLVEREDLYESRQMLFKSNTPPAKEVFSDAVHGDYNKLEQCIRSFYGITQQLMTLFNE